MPLSSFCLSLWGVGGRDIWWVSGSGVPGASSAPARPGARQEDTGHRPTLLRTLVITIEPRSIDPLSANDGGQGCVAVV